jgi:hypothetical protein
METFFIISLKSKEILLTKEFIESNNKEIIQKFILNISDILSNNIEKYSPLYKIGNKLIIFLPIKHEEINEKNDYDLIYVIIISDEEIYVPSYYSILNTIHNTLKYAFNEHPNKTLIRENIILILLMIDHFLTKGIPNFNDTFVLSTLTSPYGIKDKISEKIMGIAKNYNSNVLKNYLSNLQLNKNENYMYKNEDRNKFQNIYFDYIDNLYVTLDKKSNIINNKCYSEIIANCNIEENVPLNMLLNIPYQILSFSIDENVTTKRKEIIKKKTIDLKSKHGKFTIIKMIPLLENNFIQLPFSINANSSVTNDKINITFELNERKIKEQIYEIQNIKINLKINIENDSLSEIRNINLAGSYGKFDIDERNKEINWEMNNIRSNTNTNMKGSVLIKSNNITDNVYICNCHISMICFVDKYSITGGNLIKVNIPDKYNYISKKYKNKTNIKLEFAF